MTDAPESDEKFSKLTCLMITVRDSPGFSEEKRRRFFQTGMSSRLLVVRSMPAIFPVERVPLFLILIFAALQAPFLGGDRKANHSIETSGAASWSFD